MRYIHLNPVRAEIVSRPEKYLWSSHRSYLRASEFTWLNKNRVLKNFGESGVDCIGNFEKYILKGIGVVKELDFKSGFHSGIIGNDVFKEKIANQQTIHLTNKIELTQLVSIVCEQYDVTHPDLCMPGKHPKQSHVRAMLAYMVREIEGLSFEMLARLLNRESSGLSKLASRFEQKKITSSAIFDEVKNLRQKIFPCQE